jgi:small-conductance mechanosensitive channel
MAGQGRPSLDAGHCGGEREVLFVTADALLDWLRRVLWEYSLYGKVARSAAVVLSLGLVSLVIQTIIDRRTDNPRVLYRWRKALTFVFLLGALFLGWIWFEEIRSWVTFLGLLSAGLAIALREPLTNLAGWVFILWRRPFAIGDRVEVGAHAGDVVDIRLFQFTLLEIGNWVDADQSTGRAIHVPNGVVFGTALVNYHKGLEYIWNELPVMVTFESDWEHAKALLQGIADRHAAHLTEDAREHIRRAAHRYLILYAHLTPVVYTQVESYGVRLTVRYLCEPRRRRSSEAAIWEDVLRTFADNPDVEFAYPTQRFFDRRAER